MRRAQDLPITGISEVGETSTQAGASRHDDGACVRKSASANSRASVGKGRFGEIQPMTRITSGRRRSRSEHSARRIASPMHAPQSQRLMRWFVVGRIGFIPTLSPRKACREVLVTSAEDLTDLTVSHFVSGTVARFAGANPALILGAFVSFRF